ncbi:sensor histidine kinase NtrY-like [Sphingomicrobium clamense]|uniref:histidine kinase n=1 Tax=Sphingomicrobium clamense TaxID=2851013 RepID=A0ABS6V6G8_9SPHN|nr:ATP-binding protein [Sphingomicrobium sp. B8]MBW0145119.1 HAMP domain-containing protein [Sphingomicrobium sp. B8]
MDAATPESDLTAATEPQDKKSRRFDIITWVIAGILVLTLGYAADMLLHEHAPGELLTPFMIAALMVASLLPAIALMVLLSRKIAHRRALREGLGTGRLHTKLVALFSVIAAVPTVIVAIFASLLIQAGLEFWFSDSARGMLSDTVEIVDGVLIDEQTDVAEEAEYMAYDLARHLESMDVRSDTFAEEVRYQTYVRELQHSAVLRIEGSGEVETLVAANDGQGAISNQALFEAAQQRGEAEVIGLDSINQIAFLTQIPNVENGYVLAIRELDPRLREKIDQADAVRQAYDDILERSRTNQLQFNAALFFGSIIIVALAIAAALALADRLARPVGRLVEAAGRVEEGDFSARVPEEPDGQADEIATLSVAFNRMTGRIEEQTGALLAANTQLDTRRAFIEAVLSSVTAGVIAIDEDDRILLTNRSAAVLLGDTEAGLEGKKLATLSPELEEFMEGEAGEANVTLPADTGPRTLAIKRVRYADGAVLTFDDITDQLSDQRRAAWSDIARRIAHEIKNPLTPIQLAAERLQRRYGDTVPKEDDTFERLTGTIVRQVGDLRRMVDEFSNFARMPKPQFRDENIHDIARAALFLHEVAHPGVTFTIEPAHADIRLVCDRRQMAQALTNIVKNAVEAIEGRRKNGDEHPEGDRIDLRIEQGDGDLVIHLFDTGTGLPEDRQRLTEPYMTTRVRGTGLGLAIVKKIVEEHLGDIAFLDRPEGGTHVRIHLPKDRLAEMADGGPADPLTKRGDDDEYDEDMS